MYYSDLTPYSYIKEGRRANALNIGWLDNIYPYNEGTPSDLFLDGLFFLCRFPINKTRGCHICPFCNINSKGALKVSRKGKVLWLGTAEIRVKGKNEKIYAAPDLIFHYVHEHNYKPPEEFIEAVCNIEKIATSKIKIIFEYYSRAGWVIFSYILDSFRQNIGHSK